MKKSNYIYTGVFFDKEYIEDTVNRYITKDRLARVIKNPHVTFTYKPEEVNPRLFGTMVVFVVIGYANDGKNQGLQVVIARPNARLAPEYVKIGNPHVTISVSADGKPVDTGKMIFTPIEQPFNIHGYYGAFNGKEVVTYDEEADMERYLAGISDSFDSRYDN